MFTNTLFGFFRAYTFIALFAAAGKTIGGLTLQETLTFTFVTQGMLMTIQMWGWWDIAETVRTGDVVTDLFRPYDYQTWWLAQDIGRAVFHLLARGILPFLAGAMVFDLRLPTEPITWLWVILSITLAVLVSFAIRFLANLSTFWLLDYRGTGSLLLTAWAALSGFIVPVSFFPRWIASFIERTPFAATIQIPIEVFLEKRAGASLAAAFLVQAAWAFVLLALGRWVLAIATRRVVTQGG